MAQLERRQNLVEKDLSLLFLNDQNTCSSYVGGCVPNNKILLEKMCKMVT